MDRRLQSMQARGAGEEGAWRLHTGEGWSAAIWTALAGDASTHHSLDHSLPPAPALGSTASKHHSLGAAF